MIDYNKCSFSDCAALNAEGGLDDTQTGEFGYRVFYDVPKDELIKTGLFEVLDENVIGGELEFTVDDEGNLQTDEEVLLWTTIETEDGNLENDDFEDYWEDISPLVSDFNAVVRHREDLELE